MKTKDKITIWIVWVDKRSYFSRVHVKQYDFATNEELSAFYLGIKEAKDNNQYSWTAFTREPEAKAFASGAKAG